MPLTGGVVFDVWTRQNETWRPVGPVVDEWASYTRSATDGYVCLGVLGNDAHFNKAAAEDHTPRSVDSITLNGKTYSPLKGWIYAIDGRVPEMGKFESWFVTQLRAGRYRQVKYFNINGRHWNRAVVSAKGMQFARAFVSPDQHLHVSFMPGFEYARSTVLADYEVFRTSGHTPPAPAPAPPVDWVRATALLLPTLRQGSKGVGVRILQATLRYHGRPAVIDGIFGPDTDRKVRAFQVAQRVPNSVVAGKGGDGIVGHQTWLALVPDTFPTVIRGVEGQAAELMQLLLAAHGRPTTPDGDAGPDTIAALKAFQVDARVPSSVVAGKGDGICGPRTWSALLTA